MFLCGLRVCVCSNRPTWTVQLKRICIIQMYIWIFNKYFIWKTKTRTGELWILYLCFVAEAPHFYFRLNLIRQVYSFLTNKNNLDSMNTVQADGGHAALVWATRGEPLTQLFNCFYTHDQYIENLSCLQAKSLQWLRSCLWTPEQISNIFSHWSWMNCCFFNSSRLVFSIHQLLNQMCEDGFSEEVRTRSSRSRPGVSQSAQTPDWLADYMLQHFGTGRQENDTEPTKSRDF